MVSLPQSDLQMNLLLLDNGWKGRHMRRTILAFSLAIGVSLGIATVAPPVSAASSCDTQVIDSTSDQVLGDTSRIEMAINQLEDLGIDARVRAFERTPAGGLESYQKEQVRTCPTWQDPNGHTKGNLMTFLFAMDRQSAIFYGTNLEPELEGDVDRIRADYMNAEFRNGNFPEGIIGAISESANVIDEYNHPPADTGSDADETSSSSGSSAVWRWLVFGALGLLTLGLVAYGIKELLEFRRRRKEEWKAAHDAAYAASDSAAVTLLKINGPWGTLNAVTLLSPQLNDEDKKQLDNLVADFGALEENAIAKNAEIVDKPAVYSLEERRSTVEYRAIEAAHEEVRALAADAAGILSTIEATCKEKEQDIARAPETLQARRMFLDELTAKHTSLQEEGYRFTLQENFAKVSVLLETAGREIEAKRHGQALDELDGSEVMLDEIKNILARIPEWHQGLQKEHAALATELAQVKVVVADAMKTREEISLQFSDCDEDLLGEPQAAKLISQVAASLAEASLKFGMDQQLWSEADQLLSNCEQTLTELKQGCEAITARLDRACELESGFTNRVSDLTAAIAECSSQLGPREGDQGRFRASLETAVGKLNKLERSLDSKKPNPLAIDLKLGELEVDVERIDEESEEEHRQTRRRRQQEEEAERRRRRERDSYQSSSGLGTGFAAGSVFGSSHGSSGGGFDFGGGGSSGGSDGGGSSGSW